MCVTVAILWQCFSGLCCFISFLSFPTAVWRISFLDIPRDACHFVKHNLISTAVNTPTSFCHRLQLVSSIYVHEWDWQQMERALRSICLDSTAAHEFGCQWSICQSLGFRLHFVCVASPCEHGQHSSLGGPCRRGCRHEQDRLGWPRAGSVTVTPS